MNKCVINSVVIFILSFSLQAYSEVFSPKDQANESTTEAVIGAFLDPIGINSLATSPFHTSLIYSGYSYLHKLKPSSVTFGQELKVSYNYDGKGRVKSIISNNLSKGSTISKITYSEDDLLISFCISSDDGKATFFLAYDDDNRLISLNASGAYLSYKNKKVKFTKNANENNVVTYNYEDSDNLTFATKVHYSATPEQPEYDYYFSYKKNNSNFLTEVELSLTPGGEIARKYLYTYDRDDNITSIALITPDNQYQYDFKYDDQGRFISDASLLSPTPHYQSLSYYENLPISGNFLLIILGVQNIEISNISF